MGKKGGWFYAVKKALSPESKEKKNKDTGKSKKKWFRTHKSSVVNSLSENTPLAIDDTPLIEDVKLTKAENEDSKHAYSVAFATAVAAEAAAEVVRLTKIPHYFGKSKEEIAAIKIQTAYRGYIARRALRALRGLVRLKSLIRGQYVKRQATTTLRCMQTLAHVQSQIRARRIRMSEENQALQYQLQQKRDRELEILRASVTEEWDDSTKSKEQIEAKLLHKQEAAMRRERALAYAFSHQQMWKNSSKSSNPTFMDPNNPHWGWSWLERWMAARPWETTSTVDNHDRVSLKSATSHATSIGDINKSSGRLDRKPSSRITPTTQKPTRTPSSSSVSRKTKPASPKGSHLGGDDDSKSQLSVRKTKPASPKGSHLGGEDDSRSQLSVKSERYRRHSIAGSSIRDDESLTSSPSVPSYMAPTECVRAKSRFSSPSDIENKDKSEKGSSSTAKKRLSFTASPAIQRRHSGPPKINTSSIKDKAVVT